MLFPSTNIYHSRVQQDLTEGAWSIPSILDMEGWAKQKEKSSPTYNLHLYREMTNHWRGGDVPGLEPMKAGAVSRIGQSPGRVGSKDLSYFRS